MEHDKIQDALQDCEEKVKQLEEENLTLRLASGVFGQLAERLTSKLNNERRMTATDRRLRPRHYAERRQRML